MNKGDPYSVVLCGISLSPLAEELRAVDLGILSPFYADNAAVDGSVRSSVKLLKLFMERGSDRGYFPEPSKLLFILYTMGQ